MVEANSSVSVWDEILENTLLEEKKTSVLLLFGKIIFFYLKHF
jgi:hypothetical protein